ncbi:MAG TPA: DUF3426 domain-containing protein [Burkholderiaceae bacterium]|nr:DUF3426 domain-containing protein [Burkholderiaceae bacterium]
MALATKCPQCGAMFRVVADQLKLRGGLVRCGQCRTVFDAIGSLAYVEDATLAPSGTEATGVSAERGSSRPAQETPAESAARPAPRDERPAEPTRRPARDRAERKQRKVLGPATTLRIAPGSAPIATVSLPLPNTVGTGMATQPAREPDPAEAGVPTLLAPDFATRLGDAPAHAPLQGIEVIEMAPMPEPEATGAGALDEPEFIRAAAKPRPRGFSIIFSGGALLLALFAAAQLAVIFRADALAYWPSSRPMLANLCDAFGCTLGWPTQPDQLAVIASELQSISGTDVLELTAVIRNRAPFTQALPALEVTLSDTQNRPVARKVFTPADYLVASGEPRSRIEEGLAAGADMTIRLFFEARGLQAAGFLVYPFYI